MAMTSAICNSFKEEILQGGHCLNASGSTAAGNAIKCALYSSNSATLSKSTTVYAAPSDGTADPTSTYEVTTTSSGYTGGGNTLTNIDVTLDSTTDMVGYIYLTDIIISDPKSCSTAQLLFEVLKNLEYKHLINKDVAECLYAGIMTDTGSFKYSSTTSKTHSIVSELINNGVQSSKIHDLIYDNYSENRMKLLDKCLKFIKTRVDLDLSDYKNDIFSH